ncbi:MAG: homoserine kinase [Anaerolineae bacterium]|nr:homoserine kinase [Anaerolineae bacterium]
MNEPQAKTVSTSPKTRVTAFAPATVANLGMGFDILGMALSAPGDRVTAQHSATPGVVLHTITGDDGRLPTDPDKNTACIAARETLRLLGVSTGVQLTLEKGLPLASGLGSSAASAVAAAVAVNELFGAPLRRAELLPACVEAEAVVSGRHADNVAPGLLGGIVLVTGLDAESVYNLPTPDGMHLALVTPDIAVPTAQARAVLPTKVTLKAMVRQTGLVATFLHAVYTQNMELMARVMQQDLIIGPARAPLIPGLSEARNAAYEAGAMACFISGAGPTICALCDTPSTAGSVIRAFSDVYQSLGIASQAITAIPGSQGAYVVQSSSE